MTAKQALMIAENTLKEAGIEPFQFEARQLLEFVTGLTKKDLLVGDSQLNTTQFSELQAAVTRRINGEPLQYILGVWEFYSLPFKVGPGVLVPRADTEVLVDAALEFLKYKTEATVLDLCSGSGCIAISVAKNIPTAHVSAVEKSPIAAEYLKQNMELNNVSIDLFLEDIETFSPSKDGYDLIVSNPPYIPSDDIALLQQETRNEPLLALDGGADGLDFYRIITHKYAPFIKPGGKLGVEIGIGQADAVTALFAAAGLKNIVVYSDLGRIDRAIFGTVVL